MTMEETGALRNDENQSALSPPIIYIADSKDFLSGAHPLLLVPK
jgi:hypothetical protein